MDEHPKPEPKRSLSHTGIEYNLRFFSNQIINLKQAGDYVHTDIPQATMNAANEEVQRQEALKYLSNRVNIGVLLRIRNLHVIQTRNTDPNLLHDQINELVRKKIEAVRNRDWKNSIVPEINNDIYSMGGSMIELYDRFAAGNDEAGRIIEDLYKDALTLGAVDSGDTESKNEIIRKFLNEYYEENSRTE